MEPMGGNRDAESGGSRGPQGRVVCSATGSAAWVWEVEGPPGAPTVVLLHGWMATAALNWYGSLEYLGRSFHVVAPNLRGHGRGGGGERSAFDLEGCADDLAAMIRELALEGALVVGYSMGGAVAQVLARRHRELVGGIVLCATAASFARRLRLRPAVRVVSAAITGAARAWPQGATAFLVWRLALHDRRRVGGRDKGRSEGAGAVLPFAPGGDGAAQGGGRDQPNWALAERSLSDLAAFVRSGAILNAFDSSAWLVDLDLPAAVVVTSRDTVISPWRQEAMAALLHGARRYVVEAGHDAAVAHPDVFLPVLARACAELARA